MLRNLLATTAVVALVSSGAIAAENEVKTDEAAAEKAVKAEATYEAKDSQFLASDFLGKSVYNGTGDDAERVGEIGDVVLNQEGEIAAIVIDAGGFLGIGEKQVAINYDQLSWTEKENGERWVTISMSKEELENASEFDRTAFMHEDKSTEVYKDGQQAAVEDKTSPSVKERMAAENPAEDKAADEQMSAETAESKDKMAADQKAEPKEKMAADQKAEPKEEMAANETERDSTTAGDNTREGLSVVSRSELSADDLIGTTVYGSDDENIGEIGDIILSDKEQIEAYVINVGGFLGIGEKPVAVDAENLDILTDQNGNFYIYTSFTEEQLDDAPEYDEQAYRDNRDSNILYTK